MRRVLRALLTGLAVATAAAGPALAWTRPGHMVAAAIAYDEIERRRPDLIAPIAEILDAHPDRAPFQVAVDRTTGAERRRRMFLECARWPDDMRLTGYDHPGWHIVLWPVLADDAPEATRARLAAKAGRPTGQALEGLALNAATLGDPQASLAERAVSLCWILHVAADLHQPFHTTELFSAAYPDGDRGAGLQWLLDPVTHAPVSLHWLWDDAVHRSGTPDSVDARARALEAQYPRGSLKELAAGDGAADFEAWARESHALALSFALTSRPPTSPDQGRAPPTPDAYWTRTRELAARRATLAGYRLADVVIRAMGAPR